MNLLSTQVKGNSRHQRAMLLRQMSWDDFCLRDPVFVHRTLRMSLQAFEKLVCVLEEDLKTDEQQGKRRGGAVPPKLRLFAFIRYIAGGSYLDVCNLLGISKTSFYAIIRQVRDAINLSQHQELDNVHFPQSTESCMQAAYEFRSISTKGVMNNVTSVIDGYLLRISTPSKKEVGNVRSYFSGHYQCNGVNIQAGCDAFCRFTYVGVAGPGVMPDRDAINEGELGNLIENLPLGYVVIGDAAYTPTDRLAALFYGDSATVEQYDNFNFYGSQCRIRIEMAFGLMQQKWGILQKPLRTKVCEIKHLLLSIVRLHNYCITERLCERGEVFDSTEDANNAAINNSPSTMHAPDSTPFDDENATEHLYSHISFLQGQSVVREQMVERVATMGLRRPKKNMLNTNN